MKALVQHRIPDSDKAVLQALIPFLDLNSRAIFTQKVLSNDVESETDLFSDVEANVEFYQRRLDVSRLREIKKYIFNSVLDEKDKYSVSALFPTAMIVAVEKDIDDADKDGLVELEFSDRDRLYIVDGQHRLMAMRLLYQNLKRLISPDSDIKYLLDYLENYKFSCTVLVNFDVWEQGQVFVNVNFKQKPVNKSLYYDVFGAEYVENDDRNNLLRNKIFLCHEITRFMNSNPNSPFYKKIKMLGTGHGYISQSFLVEALLPHFKPSGIWYFDPMSKDSSQKVLDVCNSELFNYFYTVSKCFDKYWGKDQDGKVHFICKTTGVGAFTRLLSVIHRKLEQSVVASLQDIAPGNLHLGFQERLTVFLSPIVAKQDYLFGPGSSFSGSGGGKGLEGGLYNAMVQILVSAGRITEEESRSRRSYSRG